MKLTKVLMAVAVMATLAFVSCKPKDADIKATIEAEIKADPMMAGAMVDVKDGVATITGEMKDDACKAHCEQTAKDVKGVKSVVNNCMVAAAPPPPPASVSATFDEATMQRVKDGIKDIPGVTVEFMGDKAVLKGEVTSANRMKIMQMLSSANVLSDVSNLKDKK